MNPRHPALSLFATTLVVLACAKPAASPTPSPAGATVAAAPLPPEVGSKAPDFKFTPVTLGGIGKPTKLSALKGQTTVVWFFPKARSRG